jgi:hypothetical protein
MAAVTKASDAHIDAMSADKAFHIAGDLFAGEDLAACDFCYIKGSDGLVYRTSGAAANEAARFAGVTPKAVKSGQIVDLLGLGLEMRYASSGLTPGAMLFIGATGGLDTAATTGDAVGIAQCINDTDIRITRAV